MYKFFYEMELEISIGNIMFVHHIILSAVKKMHFVGDRVSYIVMSGCCFDVIVLKVRAPSEEKSDHSKYSFNEELEQAFDDFPKYQMKIILGYLMQKMGERIFSNRELGMRVYNRIVMIMVLE